MRRKLHEATGFTLIEVLIVVVILAILAVAVVPQFTDSSDDAKESTALMNLHTLRSQIQLYRVQHNGLTPSATLQELTIQTDASGNPGTEFGPYLQFIPENPFTGSNTVRETTENPPTAASGAADAGWLYHKASGNIWLDDTRYLNR